MPTWAGFLYLATVLDALEPARDRLGHRTASSDRARPYTAVASDKRWREAGVRTSMGSVGDAYDNALCESFFVSRIQGEVRLDDVLDQSSRSTSQGATDCTDHTGRNSRLKPERVSYGDDELSGSRRRKLAQLSERQPGSLGDGARVIDLGRSWVRRGLADLSIHDGSRS